MMLTLIIVAAVALVVWRGIAWLNYAFTKRTCELPLWIPVSISARGTKRNGRLSCALPSHRALSRTNGVREADIEGPIQRFSESQAYTRWTIRFSAARS